MDQSNAKSRRPVRAGRRLERADPVWGPVGEEGAPDDPLLGNWTPVSAVVALPTVVAHHKKVVRRNLDRLPQIAEFIARRPLRDERLLLLDELSVLGLGEVDVVVLHLDPVARQRNDALDEIVLRLIGRRLLARTPIRRLGRYPALLRIRTLWRLEHHHVAAARVAKMRSEAVDEHALTDLQGRHHGRARDPERLDEERLDPDREAERHDDDDHELDRRVGRALLLLFALPVALLDRGHDGPTGARATSGVARVGVAGVGAGRIPLRVAAGVAGPLGGCGGVALGLRCLCVGGGVDRRLGWGLRCGHFHLPDRNAFAVGRSACFLEQLGRCAALSGGGTRRRPRELALTHPGAPADPATQVVELRPAHVTAAGDLDPLDLRRMNREGALDTHAEGLLADGERLARATALALDYRALEDLGAAPSALHDLEVNLHAVAGLEIRHGAHLSALEGVDDSGHCKERAPRPTGRRAGGPMVAKDLVRLRSVSTARGSALPVAGARGSALPTAGAGALAALLPSPLRDPRVVAREQHVGHTMTVPVKRARVVRILGRAFEGLAEGLLDRAVGVPERTGQLADYGVAHHH